MQNVKIRVTFMDILIYLSLTFLCMQFFVSNNVKVGFCVFFDSIGIKHILMVGVIVFGFLTDLRSGKLRFRNFSYEMRLILAMIASLVIITFIYMVINGFSDKWILQTYFFIVPILFAYTIFRNDYSVKRFKHIVNYSMIITSILYTIFIIQCIAQGKRILGFSFVDSTGPFECEVAHFFLLIYIFYTFNQQYLGRVVSAFFCVVAWKRVCVICLILITLACIIRLRNKPIKTIYIVIMALVFTVFPIVTEYMLSPEFGQWFNEFTGLDYAEFSNFRYYTVKTAMSGVIPNKGLGTFLMIKVPWYGGYVEANMHNDLMRLYLEVSGFGLFLYLLLTGLIAKRRFAFFVILYLFIEMSGNHLIGNGGIPYWFLGYSLVFYFNIYDRDGRGKVFVAEDSAQRAGLLRKHISIKNKKITIRK